MNTRRVVINLIILTVIGILLVFISEFKTPPVQISLIHSNILGQFFYGIDHSKVNSRIVEPNITVLQEAGALGFYATSEREYDFIEVATPFAGLAYNENPNVRIIGTLIKPKGDDTIVVVNNDSQISTLGDLKGKRIGVDNVDLTPTVLLKELLSEIYDIKYDEVTYIELPLSEALGNLDAGEVDAVIIYSAYAYFARAQSKYRVLSDVFEETKQLIGDLPVAAVIVTNRIDLDSRREVLSQGLELIRDSFNYGLSHQDEISQELGKQLGIQPEIHSISFKNVEPTSIFLNPEDMENILIIFEIARKQGLIGRPINKDIFFEP